MRMVLKKMLIQFPSRLPNPFAEANFLRTSLVSHKFSFPPESCERLQTTRMHLCRPHICSRALLETPAPSAELLHFFVVYAIPYT